MDVLGHMAQLRGMSKAVGADTADAGAALEAVGELLRRARVDGCIVGGLAVVHHGYPRLTVDVGVLVEAGGLARLEASVDPGFVVAAPGRLRHEDTGVRIDVLEAGGPMPRGGSYPPFDDVGRSPKDVRFVDLPTLIRLKVEAGRRQDEADAIALLKPLDAAAYLALESAMPPRLRPALLALRRDALEELRWET